MGSIINIEGLSRTPEGALLIGFRNPLPGGKALLVPLANPQDVVDGKPAKAGEPSFLSLGGRGIRSIEYFEPKGKYLIVAGPYDDDGDFKLYEWSGSPNEDPAPVDGVGFQNFRPEALIAYPGEPSRIQLLSDDGTEQVNGNDCKDPKVEPRLKSFRSIWLAP